MIENCLNLNIGAKIGGINLSIIAYADDVVLLGNLDLDLNILLDQCDKYAKKWKLEFNSKKSIAYTTGKKFYNTYNFYLNNERIPNVDGFVYLGLPIGDKRYTEEYCNEKIQKVEKSMYSLYGLGCRPKCLHPYTIAQIYKQYSQSIFRYHLDNIYITNSKLKELNARQNQLIRNSIGVAKFNRMSPLNEALEIESIQTIYFKHKISMLKQLNNNTLTSNLFKYLNLYYKKNSNEKSCFKHQIDQLGNYTHLDLRYDKISIKENLFMINYLNKCDNSKLNLYIHLDIY